MHLPRHTIESHASAPLFTHASFSQPDDNLSTTAIAACATSDGFLIAQADPLRVLATRSWPSTQGALSRVIAVQDTSLLVLVGGGLIPRFAPNKVILWDEGANSFAKGKSRQDDAASTRSHSTLFSAGSKLESHSKRSQHTSRSASPEDSLKFSASSLVDHAESSSAGAQSSMNSSTTQSESKYSDALAFSVESVQAHEDTAIADIAASSLSISASSADLDDPFASDESAPPQTEHRKLSHSAFLQSAIEPPRTGHPPLVEQSISSLASAETQATARLPHKPSQGREVAELEFSEIVRGVHVTACQTTITMVVTLSTKAIVFDLAAPRADQPRNAAWSITKRASVQTYKNPKGLGAVAPCLETGNAVVVAVPGKQKGHVQILRINALARKMLPGAAGAAAIVVAHKSSLASITLSADGKLLATASSKGTLLRVWSNSVSHTPTPSATFSAHGTKVSGRPGRTGIGVTLIRELRRGTDPASILSVAFAPGGSAVAVASDKGTIHIFDLTRVDVPAGSGTRASSGSNTTYSLGALAGQIPQSMLPQYFSSEWSSAQFRIPLKTFGSSSRRGHGSATNEPVMGTEKSTEGAWAQMRGRVGDIRNGEAGVDEKIFLGWILEPAAPSANPPPSRAQAPPMVSSNAGLRLLALTTSGGWYKISIDAAADESSSSSTTVLNMYRNQNENPRSDKIGFGCHLLEYRPILSKLDGWHI